MKKRILSLLLALCMTFALLPAAAGAEETDWPYDFSDFDFSDFDFSDFGFSDFDPSDFYPSDFDFSSFDPSTFDPSTFDPSDYDFPDFSDWEKLVEEALKEQERLEAEEAEREAQKAAEEAARQEEARREEAEWAATGGVVTIEAPRTVAELNVMWDSLKPVHTSGSPYDAAPNTKPEQGQDPTLGQVTYDVMYDGLNTLNFARYMAGLTGDVSVVYDFIVSAQYGSVLLAFLDYGLTHTPTKPTGPYRVSDSFYEKGYEGTSNSNLHLETNSRRESIAISESVKGYLADLGENNRDEAGHRYYCLDPAMTGTGFGLATSRTGQLYSAMWTGYGKTLNGTGTKTTDYEAIPWPAAGYHATDFYKSGMQWSVRLNKSLYDVSRLGDVKVTVTGPSGTAVVPHVISSDKMVIFTPTESVRAGEQYTVEISGLYRKDRSATLKYSVEFFDLAEPGATTADLMAIDKIAMESGLKEFSAVATNYNKPEDLLRCLWAETRFIDSLAWVSDPVITQATSSKSGSFKGTLQYTLNGTSATFNVNMTIPEVTASKNANLALTAAKAMTVSASTTREEVERYISAGLESGWTVSITSFEVFAPTDTEIGLVYYEFTVGNGSGTRDKASIVQVIPVLGRKALEPSIPATGTAYPSTQAVTIDGKKVEFQMYALRDANGNPTNYVKVRDLALALNGTKGQFGVDWDGAVSLTAGKSYTPNNSENQTPFSGERSYALPGSPTKVNGANSGLTAIILTDDAGGGYTYYKLRDLGKALGFNVDWSAETGIFIETDKPYSGD